MIQEDVTKEYDSVDYLNADKSIIENDTSKNDDIVMPIEPYVLDAADIDSNYDS